MSYAPTIRLLIWVQMTPKSARAVNPLISGDQGHGDEPLRRGPTANGIKCFATSGFKVQNGFKSGSLNPRRFTGSRAYMYARNLNLATNDTAMAHPLDALCPSTTPRQTFKTARLVWSSVCVHHKFAPPDPAWKCISCNNPGSHIY